jgi:plasmid stabilization system protein ParE
MKVVIREAAEDDLNLIAEWIARDNPSAATRVIAKIRDRISFLEMTKTVKSSFWRSFTARDIGERNAE